MTNFIQLLLAGIALGATYALVAIGFVIIYKATGVFNFAQGEFLALGAYLVFFFTSESLSIPFWGALALAMVGTALFGVLVERFVLRVMIGKEMMSIIVITLGLTIAMQAGLGAAFGYDQKGLPGPWGSNVVHLGEIAITEVNLWRIGLTVLIVVLLGLFFARSRWGVAMRATALDQEAARAMGVNVKLVFALTWAIAAALAAVGGVLLAGFPRVLDASIALVALRSLPGVIIGGLDSIPGAIVGGLAVGLVEVLVSGYQPSLAPWLGINFHIVAPYLLMLIVIWIRPHGLFGTERLIRV